MAELDLIWMSVVIFLPSLFALVLVFFPHGWDEAVRWWALFGTALTLGACTYVFFHVKADTIDLHNLHINAQGGYKASLAHRLEDIDHRPEGDPALGRDWLASIPWIGRFNINYYLGVDGISLPLILLTTILFFLSMVASWSITKFVRGYCILFLVLETGVLGVFFALDFFLFFIFWEVMLLPMYFLIGIWGGPRREYAAIKFFLYTMLGSVFILIAMLAFYFTNVIDFVSPKRIAQAIETSDVPAAENVRLLQSVVNEHRKTLQNSPEDKPEKTELQLADARANLEQAKTQLAQSGSFKVGTFDLVVLQRVGLAALADLNGQEVTNYPSVGDDARKPAEGEGDEHDAPADLGKVFSLAAAQHELEHIQGRVAEAKDPKLKDTLTRQEKAIEERIQAIKDGRQKRLDEEWFFQPTFQYAMFLFLLVGFAIKIPVFPFHTWLPDAHVEAPTPISMILAGILLKLGGYGIIRLAYPICPWAAQQLAAWVGFFGIINIVYGAFAAMAQTDFKKLVAYSSISHMGYVLLGIAVWASPATKQYWAWGMNGAMFQMIAHGITSAGMFFLVGVIYDRAHHRNLDNFRGLYEPMPLYGGISAIIFFAAMGLPGMCGFVGEFMVVLSTWNFAPGGHRWIGITFAVLAALTVVLTAAYILWTVQRVFMGTNEGMAREYNNYPDMTVREALCIAPLVIIAVLLGVLPGYLLLNWMEPSVTHLVDSLASLP